MVSAVFASALVCAGCGGRGGDAREIVLKAADDHELGYPTTRALVRMGELLNEWTGGRIVVQVYHSAQLGSEKETIEQTQFGAIDIDRVNIAPVTQIVPAFNIFALPYLFRDDEHMHAVLDGEIGAWLLGRLEEHGLVGLGYYDSGQRSFYNSLRPVREPSDLGGMKIRVQKAEIMLDLVKALGASPTPMAFEEVYSALQTGVIDGAENNFPSYITKGHYEVAKYYTVDAHSRTPEVLLFSRRTWEKLSSFDQALVRKAAKESVPYQRRLWAERVEESKRKAVEAGCEIIDDIDRRPFIDAVRPLYEKYGAGYGDLIGRIQSVP
jgi:tripartite ATP-independent transporter DctP family solute receptor